MELGSKEMIERARAASTKALEERKLVIAQFNRENTDHLKNYLRGIPGSMQWGWLSNYLGKSSPLKAIKAKCYDCSGYDRNEVYECEAKTCPLWHFRPKKKGSANQEEDGE